MMGMAVLVSQGHSAPDALHIVRTGRWQAAPNDRQLKGLVEFERYWRRRERAAAQGQPEPAIG
jgi:hypothetical protein